MKQKSRKATKKAGSNKPPAHNYLQRRTEEIFLPLYRKTLE